MLSSCCRERDGGGGGGGGGWAHLRVKIQEKCQKCLVTAAAAAAAAAHSLATTQPNPTAAPRQGRCCLT